MPFNLRSRKKNGTGRLRLKGFLCGCVEIRLMPKSLLINLFALRLTRNYEKNSLHPIGSVTTFY